MKNLIVLSLGALFLSSCTVTSKHGGDYASFSILTENVARGDICTTISLSEEHELLRQLQDDDIKVILIDDHLVKKYGKLSVMECYATIIGYHNRQAVKMLGEVREKYENESVVEE
jgi:hypothetical protein